MFDVRSRLLKDALPDAVDVKQYDKKLWKFTQKKCLTLSSYTTPVRVAK
jgi:hypothetical protein